MSKNWTGARLARYALEQLGITHTFGIPGVHNTELYDELASSSSITPVLVTHEGGASFMADAISRTSASVGTLLIVPAAGVTHAASGIAEAFLDGIPMLVIAGGIRTDTGKHYQLHELDQLKLVETFTKARFRVSTHEEIVPTLFEAYRCATHGEPGPVFVEIPVNLQLFTATVDSLPTWQAAPVETTLDMAAIAEAATLLAQAKRPGLFLGWGARGALKQTLAIAEHLGAPVATTLQGLSAFPGNHPLHTGLGFGPAAVPAATQAFKDCDCLLAVGTRFAEISTGSYGSTPPTNLIHIDINPAVFNVNYPARVAIAADAAVALQALVTKLQQVKPVANNDTAMRQRIAEHKQTYQREWLAHDSGERVNPACFFNALRAQMADDAYLVADDGNHTFLVAELFENRRVAHFISPTDFNCMGYCVPAAIGVKLAHPRQQVVGIVGDGAFQMTCMEILTASALGLGVIYCVFHDGELAQIAQAQELPYNRKTCTTLPSLNIKGVAEATGAMFYKLASNDSIEIVLKQAMTHAVAGRPVIIDVAIDYSKKTRFTQGILATNLGRFPLGMKVRLVTRALTRKIMGAPKPGQLQ